MKTHRLLVELLICTFFAAAVPVIAAEPQVIKDRLDEINYSLGYQLGQQLREKKLEFRPETLWQGVYDGANHAQPFMTEEAMRRVLEQLAPQSPAAAERPAPKTVEPQKDIIGYRLEGQKFIAENSQKEGVESLPSGVQYKILKTGQGKHPQPTDAVLVNYKAKNVDGEVYDSSFPLGIPTPTEFKVNKLIPGLAQVLPMMREGDKWEIYIPTRMAYRDTGPMAGQTVIYEMELLEILPEFH
ncbi:FKBP-type peptidyl-prolyl cis-trans isomerase N-terminal domain-containing protein [Pelobacter seleniigenes]|uniref:FKBP-type peptidyl-prolyl cis-trans isomerase N-terminal domain-containing protein n=1 Tax=Pelobacter seleniigenes TaxID=407188 RepID=UPI0004A724C3|nr:FKBP-type peptidyl-prolyl cis-trans isomerase N-terminal domain-containing protein [Pelobacter seleniigenes]